MAHMLTGVFSEASDGYLLGAKSLWQWLGESWWLLRPLVIIWVLPASAVLFLVGAVLRLGTIFDLFAHLVEVVRREILRVVSETARTMLENRTAYFFAPLVIIPVTPLVVAAGFIPKIGLANLIPDNTDDISLHPNGRYFRRALDDYRKVLTATKIGLTSHGIAFFPCALVSATILFPWVAAMCILFLFFRGLDLISAVLDWARNGVLGGVHNLGYRARSGLVAAFLCPILLMSLLPILLLVLVVPKLTTTSHHA